ERFVLGIPGGVAEILPQMLQSTGAAIQGGLVGAAGGAATGAAAGFGAGGGPGAALGARFGAQAGFRTGSSLAVFMSAAKMEAGHAFVELRGITDETGQPIDPALAKTTALAVGAVNGALERLSFGVLTKHIPGLRSIMGREGAKRALQSAGVRRVLSGIAFSSAEGAATEGITEGVQEATAIIGEIVDGAITRGQSITEAIEAFSYAGRDPLTGEEIALTGADAIWARVVSSAVSGAQGGAGAAGAGRAMRVVADSQRAQAAIQRMPGLERMRELVGASRLLRRDKEAFREHVRTVAEDSGVRSVYIDAAALREWSTTADQKAVRQLFQDVEALQEQDEEVARTGADFQIPLEDFLAYVATNEAAADLMDAVRFDPMDMTAREALGFEEGLVRELGTFSELAGEARDGAQARDLLAGEVRAQLLKVHPDTVVDPMVELTVARYETRAQRLGIPLEELLQREGLFRVEPPNATEAERQGMLPPTLENRLDEAAVRRVVADLRKGQDLLPAGVSSTPMLDAIRALGGVDPEGDLGVGLRELEIPQAGRRGLVRKGGITNADQIVADETPLFVEAGLANAEGLVDHDRLIAAIQDEILGRPFRTADEGAVLADVQRERDAVLEALDAAGLSLESSDDEIVAVVARREFEQPAFHGTPHEFERFDITKIGTGEGAQAFGWGLYFSSSRGIAEYYREMLSNGVPVALIDGKQIAPGFLSGMSSLDVFEEYGLRNAFEAGVLRDIVNLHGGNVDSYIDANRPGADD
ncbi:MAG: hypothetical protein KC616_25930, partial [Myxococcales bacterium]|nr:hypothetical protein [Myxococcales bacterium]